MATWIDGDVRLVTKYHSIPQDLWLTRILQMWKLESRYIKIFSCAGILITPAIGLSSRAEKRDPQLKNLPVRAQFTVRGRGKILSGKSSRYEGKIK